MTSPDSQGPPRTPEDEELERLRAENARLRASMAVSTSGRRRGWWRPLVAGLLVALAALLAPLSVVATWASGQINETDRYVESVAPLANDPDVQDAIATRVEEVIFSYLDLEQVTDELVAALSARGISERAAVTLQAVAGPLTAGIRSFVVDRIHALVESDVFEQAWVEANRTAHAELVSVLTGEQGGAVEVDDGAVRVNLAAVINAVKQQLTAAGFNIAERIPEVQAQFTIVESANLAKFQQLVKLLDALSTWLPVVGLGLLAGAIILARDRRRMVLAAGLAVAGAMLLLGATLNVIRPLYLDALPESASQAAAGAVYDQLVSFIRFALRGLLVVALSIAAAAWLSAPTGAGAAARKGLVRGIDGLRRLTSGAGLDTGSFGVALREYKSAIRVGLLGVVALAYLLQDHPTTGTALTFVIVTAVCLLVLEVLAAPPPPGAELVHESREA